MMCRQAWWTIWRNRSTIRGSCGGIGESPILASTRLPCRSRAHSRYDCPNLGRDRPTCRTGQRSRHFRTVAANNCPRRRSTGRRSEPGQYPIRLAIRAHPKLVDLRSACAAGTVSAFVPTQNAESIDERIHLSVPHLKVVDRLLLNTMTGDRLKRPSDIRCEHRPLRQWHVAHLRT